MAAARRISTVLDGYDGACSAPTGGVTPAQARTAHAGGGIFGAAVDMSSLMLK